MLKTTEELQNRQKGREKTAESHVSVKQVAHLVKIIAPVNTGDARDASSIPGS